MLPGPVQKECGLLKNNLNKIEKGCQNRGAGYHREYTCCGENGINLSGNDLLDTAEHRSMGLWARLQIYRACSPPIRLKCFDIRRSYRLLLMIKKICVNINSGKDAF